MNNKPIIYTVIAVTILAFVLTKAEKVTPKFPKPQFNPGETSYFDNMKRASQHFSKMENLRTNESMREEIEDTMETLSKLTDPRALKDFVSTRMSGLGGNLLSEVFSDVPPSQCINDTGRILSHIANVTLTDTTDWAVQMLDSMGKPGPSLTLGRLKWIGNYEQCREVQVPADPKEFSKGFNGAYVAATIIIGNPYDPMNAIQAQWGLCLPDTCSAPEIYMLLNDTLALANMTTQVILTLPDILTDEREYTGATYAIIIILSIIGALMIIGTTYDIVYIQWDKWSVKDISNSEDESSHLKNGIPQDHQISMYGTTKIDEKSPKSKEPGKLVQTILAFSVYTNASKFLNTSQPPGSLGAIHGIRFLSMSWVILGHIYYFGLQFFVNSVEIKSLTKRWTFDAIDNALVSVDTFFALSGLLTTYLTIKEMQKKGWKINWGLFYFHRFWRLTPPYMMVLLLILGLQRFFGNGALWATTQPQDKNFCETSWWTNLLYINNLVRKEESCMGHSWYMANDMQFFIISPLMIIPLYFNMYAGMASCCVFLLINWITTGYLSIDNGWADTIFGGAQKNLVDYAFNYYWAPWCRIGPFVIGVITGYCLAINKGRIPLNRTLNVVGWTLATAAGIAIVYGIHGDETGDDPSTIGVAAFYNAVARSAWAACVCWVIVSCTSGYGGFVNYILTWSPFVVLGRLTYMAYLIHPCLLYIYFGNMDQLFYINDLNVIISYLGMLVFAFLTAFVLSMTFESPMIGLEKVFIPRRRD